MEAKTLQAGLEDELLPVEAQVPRPAQTCPGACVTDASAWSPSPSACCAFPFLWDGDGDGEAEEHNSCVEVALSLILHLFNFTILSAYFTKCPETNSREMLPMTSEISCFVSDKLLLRCR